MSKINLFVFILVIFHFVEGSIWVNRTATIAVVEYQPILNVTLTAEARIMANTEKYIDFIKSLNQTKCDMIIFPEATLRNDPETAVDVKINANPCDSPNSEFMYQLSCAARTSNAYLVINIVEKEKCHGASSSKNCQNYGFFFYNTDVIFDRQGTIVAKYRKYNLFGERELDKPSSEEVVIYTDFGVKYGIFTCFDVLFKTPAQDLLGKDIDGVVFPTMWFSQLPFLTALQTQQMWAHAHDIKVFTAGANNPVVGSGGTGFYSGTQGMILGDIIANGGSKAYVYKYVTGEPPSNYNPQEPAPYEDPDVLGKEMDQFYLDKDSSLEKYNSTVLDTSKEQFTEKLCYENGTENRICCEFDIKISVDKTESDKNNYVYLLVAYSGVRSFKGMYNGGIELCGLIACLNSSLSSCGERFPNYNEVHWPITFQGIEIKGNFEKNENKTQYPNSVLSSIRPINASQTVWEGEEVLVEGKTMIERRFLLLEPQNRILTFAIFGRNFGQDSPEDNSKDSGVKSVNVTWFLAVFVVVLFVFALK